MTGRVVERDARTAYRSASVPATGGSALMPPHSQGAERRTEHRAGRTGSRWGLRALVIGGLAGVAWLLTGAAAQVANRDPADEGLLGSSFLGSVADIQHSIPVVDRVLRAAAQPPVSEDHRARSVVAFPGELPGRPAAATHDNHDAGSAPGGVDSVLRGLTAPLRLSGEAVDTRLVPDTDLQEPAPPRADTVPAAPERPTAKPVTSSGSPAPDVHEAVADQSEPDPAGIARTIAGLAGPLVDTDKEEPAAVRQHDRRHQVGRTVTRQRTVAADRAPAAVTAAEAETVSATPGGDGPAPLRGHLGAANGVPASGPNATDGGSAAFLPARIADSTVACHRLPIVADVEVRRHDAEAPTVSPD